MRWSGHFAIERNGEREELESGTSVKSLRLIATKVRSPNSEAPPILISSVSSAATQFSLSHVIITVVVFVLTIYLYFYLFLCQPSQIWILK